MKQWMKKPPDISAAAAWTVADIAQCMVARDADIANIHLYG